MNGCPEDLKAALNWDKSYDDEAFINGSAADGLVLDQILNFINGSQTPSEQVASVLTELARRRIERAQPVLPWPEEMLRGKIIIDLIRITIW